MKKKTTKPIEIPKQIDDLEEFQAAYGADFQRIIAHPAFLAGMQFLNVRETNKIAALTNEDIEKNGREILSDFRGWLRHENSLIGLPNEQTFKLPTDEEFEYVSPEDEAAHAQLSERLAEERRKQRHGN